MEPHAGLRGKGGRTKEGPISYRIGLLGVRRLIRIVGADIEELSDPKLVAVGHGEVDIGRESPGVELYIVVQRADSSVRVKDLEVHLTTELATS